MHGPSLEPHANHDDTAREVKQLSNPFTFHFKSHPPCQESCSGQGNRETLRPLDALFPPSPPSQLVFVLLPSPQASPHPVAPSGKPHPHLPPNASPLGPFLSVFIKHFHALHLH